jgi:type IV secretory pathway VirD2 relaxase
LADDELGMRLRPRRIRSHDSAQRGRRLRSALARSRQRGGHTTTTRKARLLRGGGAANHYQRSLVKVQYVASRTPGGWRAHGRYLSREGAQREGGRGLGFDASGHDVVIEDRLGDWQKSGDRRLWKVILSPEEGQQLDLREHTRALLSVMEVDLGTRLAWVAIDHHNTAHPHVHLVIRGRDDRGGTLSIPAEYVRHGIRERSQELATRRLGYRTPQDRERAWERAIEAPHFGELDALLERRADVDRTLSFDGPLPSPAGAQVLRLQLIGRLQFLGKLGLAEQTGPRSWRLSELHPSGLRQIQLLRDVQKSVARGEVRLTDPDARQAIVDLRPGESVRGRVAGTTFGDVEGRIFVVVEASDGGVLLLPESAEIERLRGGGGLQRGTVVTLLGRELRGAGSPARTVEIYEHGQLDELERAAEVGNVLDVAVLEHAVGDAPSTIQPSASRGFDARWAEALLRRAGVLEKAGLLEREQSGALRATGGSVDRVRTQMQLRDRIPMAFSEVERVFGKPVREVRKSLHGAEHRGRLVAYAEDAAGERYAMLDVGREIRPVPTQSRAMALGKEVRARLVSARWVAERSEAERRRGLAWQLVDLERERERGRGR